MLEGLSTDDVQAVMEDREDLRKPRSASYEVIAAVKSCKTRKRESANKARGRESPGTNSYK